MQYHAIVLGTHVYRPYHRVRFVVFVALISRSHQMKLITASGLVERLKVNGSLARAAIRELEGKGLIRKVDAHHAQVIYTRATNVEE